jgi:predicted ABC-type ATPase
MERVRQGGHDVPAEVVRRRYRAGLENLFKLYIPLADGWQVFDNSGPVELTEIASGKRSTVHLVSDAEGWRMLKESCSG